MFFYAVTNINSPALNNAEVAYLNTFITKVTTTIDIAGTTATFTGASILQPPAGSSLPTTQLSNFTLLANGQSITANEITYFGEDGLGNVILTINPSVLGYYLTGKTITAKGKFQ